MIVARRVRLERANVHEQEPETSERPTNLKTRDSISFALFRVVVELVGAATASTTLVGHAARTLGGT
jgi:hypothetical protein